MKPIRFDPTSIHEPTASRPSIAPDLGAPSALVSRAGLELDELEPTRVAGHIYLGDRHHIPWGIVHGGV